MACKSRVRNSSSLEASAKWRSEGTRRTVDEALARLLQDPSQRINFNTMAVAPKVAKAYLYKEACFRDRINMLRQQQDEALRQLAFVRDRTEVSTRLLFAAKDRRVRELDAHVKPLEVELATCRGALYDRL